MNRQANMPHRYEQHATYLERKKIEGIETTLLVFCNITIRLTTNIRKKQIPLTVQYSTIQYNKTQYNTIKHNIIRRNKTKNPQNHSTLSDYI